MKHEDASFLDWLHDQRREAEADRRRRHLTGADYLRECARESAKIREELAARRQMTASDKPTTKSPGCRTREP